MEGKNRELLPGCVACLGVKRDGSSYPAQLLGPAGLARWFRKERNSLASLQKLTTRPTRGDRAIRLGRASDHTETSGEKIP
jgi:hypothetical protein